MLKTLVHHPRKLWVRRALFQVHLWLGVILSAYTVVIALSGSILVFEEELRRASLAHAPFDGTLVAPLESVLAQARTSFPQEKLTYLEVPQEHAPWWMLFLSDGKGHARTMYADARTGCPYQLPRRLFIDVVKDVHLNLLAGNTGFVVNCWMGIGLLVLAASGLVIWWPGIRAWKRALWVAFKNGWKRINYDLHSAAGFWLLLLVAWWGFSAIYFLYPVAVRTAVAAVSPLAAPERGSAAAPAGSTAVVTLAQVLANCSKVSPGTLNGIGLPEFPGDTVVVEVDVREPGDFTHRDIDTFDGHTGQLLTARHVGRNVSAGDWFVWLIYPLHFGTMWGMTIKILWALAGLGLAVLGVTGVLMYWNRYLSVRWRVLRS